MDRRWTVPASAGLLAMENVAVLAALLFRSGVPVMVLGLLLLKFPLCAALLRRRLAAVFVLIVWETVAMLVGLTNPSIAPPGQLALFGSALAGSTLLALSLPFYAPAPGGST